MSLSCRYAPSGKKATWAPAGDPDTTDANRACMAARNEGLSGDGRASVWGRLPTSTVVVVVVGGTVVVVVGGTVVVDRPGTVVTGVADGPPQAVTRMPAARPAATQAGRTARRRGGLLRVAAIGPTDYGRRPCRDVSTTVHHPACHPVGRVG